MLPGYRDQRKSPPANVSHLPPSPLLNDIAHMVNVAHYQLATLYDDITHKADITRLQLATLCADVSVGCIRASVNLTCAGACIMHTRRTMVIAYLMASERMTLLEAFATCYHHRRVTWPNRSFMKQLISYEAQINKKKGRASAKSTITIQQWDKWTAGEQG